MRDSSDRTSVKLLFSRAALPPKVVDNGNYYSVLKGEPFLMVTSFYTTLCGVKDLTGIPLTFLSTRLYVNCSRISLKFKEVFLFFFFK